MPPKERPKRPKDGPNTKASKLLSWALRHGAGELGLTLRGDGFVAVDALLAALGQRAKGITPARVRQIVAECPKQRFGLTEEPTAAVDDGGGGGGGGDGGGAPPVLLLIRANQGHSLKAVVQEELLRPLLTAAEAGAVLVHGTQVRFWGGPAGIGTRGLSRMTRQHVHFATGLPGEDGVRSGMRTGCTLLVYLDAGAALAAGLLLFMSANGVVLCPGDAAGVVPPELFARVVNLQDGTEVPLPARAAPPAGAGEPAGAAGLAAAGGGGAAAGIAAPMAPEPPAPPAAGAIAGGGGGGGGGGGAREQNTAGQSAHTKRAKHKRVQR